MKNSEFDVKNMLDTGESASIDVNDITTEEELRRLKKIKLIKLGTAAVLSALILIFVTIAWFSMNRETSTSGMGVKTAGMPFELRTSGSVGLYDDYITSADANYQSVTETDGSTQKLILKLTKGNTEATQTQGNMNNLYSGEGAPTASELREIKKLDSSKYGLSPGDYGTLKFTIVPKADSVDTTIKLSMKCFKTEYYTSGENLGYQKDVFQEMDPEDEEDSDAVTFALSHIMLFYMDDEDTMHLITEDGFDEINITSDREVTIYWTWPEKLRNILELDVAGIDQTAARELRAYMLKNPELFLAKTSEDSATVFSSITVAEDATESDIQTVANAMTSTNTAYNPWGSRYNNADQMIGDEVGYIMPEIFVDLKGNQ